MNKKLHPVMMIILTAAVAAGCSAIRPYEKEYLLNPVMEDSSVTILQPDLAKSGCASFEKLASSAAGGGGGSSCPTCGG